MDFTAISQKGERDEATGAVHFNADCICLCWSVWPPAHLCLYVLYMYVCVRKPGNPLSASLLGAQSCGSPTTVFGSP